MKTPMVSTLFSINTGTGFLGVKCFASAVPVLRAVCSSSLNVQDVCSSAKAVLSGYFRADSSRYSRILVFIYNSSPLYFTRFFIHFTTVCPIFTISTSKYLQLKQDTYSIQTKSGKFLLQLPVTIISSYY